MALLSRLRKLSSVSAALTKRAGIKRTALRAGAAVAGAGLVANAPKTALSTYRNSRKNFLPSVQKAKYGLE